MSLQATSQVLSQWTSPHDVLSILLLLGGDVVQQALAQLSGGWLTPVPFSFGWVACAMNALLLAIGNRPLMPVSTENVIVVNVASGNSRHNQSWIIGRVLRDFEHWKGKVVNEKERHACRSMNIGVDERLALSISVFSASPTTPAGRIVFDHVWLSGIFKAFCSS